MIINWDTFNDAKERMGERFPTLLEAYIKNAEEYIRQISVDNDLEELINAAHCLKSGSSILGLDDVSDAARVVEYKGKNLQKTGGQIAQDLSPSIHDLQKSFTNVESLLKVELKMMKSNDL